MFENLKYYREVGDFDLISPTIDEQGIWDLDLLQRYLNERRDMGCRHLAIDLSGYEDVPEDIVDFLWIQLGHPDSQTQGSLAVLGGGNDAKSQLSNLNQRGGFIHFAKETEMISWSVHHHEELAEFEVSVSNHTVQIEVVSPQPLKGELPPLIKPEQSKSKPTTIAPPLAPIHLSETPTTRKVNPKKKKLFLIGVLIFLVLLMMIEIKLRF